MVEKKTDDKSTFEKEVEPLIGDTPVVSIKDKDYKLRRLGISDTFKLARIIGIGAAGIGKEVSNLELTPEVAIGLLIIGFPYADQQILDFFADLLGVTKEEIRDPNKFPMGCEIDIVKALTEHIDVKAFFTKLTELMKVKPWKGFLSGASTSSKKDISTQMKN